MFTKSLKKAFGAVGALVLSATMLFAVPMQASAAVDLSAKGKFYTDFASAAETLEAADEQIGRAHV